MGLLRVSPKSIKRLTKIVDRYNAFLKKRFPVAYETQDAVFRGFRQLFHDAGIYAVLMNDRYYGKSLSAYKRSELELMWSFPTDMVKILPTMAILALPFSTFVVIPLLMLYPRIMSPPFWTEEQIVQYFTRDMAGRSYYFHCVLRDMEKSLPLLDVSKSESEVEEKDSGWKSKWGRKTESESDAKVAQKTLMESESSQESESTVQNQVPVANFSNGKSLQESESSAASTEIESADEAAVKHLKKLICQVSYGVCVDPVQLGPLKTAFRQFPFAVPYMRWRYAYDLLRMHGLHLMPFYNMYALFRPRTVLFRYAAFMRNMDLAIAREGVDSLSDDDLNRACFMRCLLPFNATKKAKQDFLNKWLSYTIGEKSKSDASPSLYLHVPIFLSYMQTQNAQLF